MSASRHPFAPLCFIRMISAVAWKVYYGNWGSLRGAPVESISETRWTDRLSVLDIKHRGFAGTEKWLQTDITLVSVLWLSWLFFFSLPLIWNNVRSASPPQIHEVKPSQGLHNCLRNPAHGISRPRTPPELSETCFRVNVRSKESGVKWRIDSSCGAASFKYSLWIRFWSWLF